MMLEAMGGARPVTAARGYATRRAIAGRVKRATATADATRSRAGSRAVAEVRRRAWGGMGMLRYL